MSATVLNLPHITSPLSAEEAPSIEVQHRFKKVETPNTLTERHTYFDDRPSWDNFGLVFFTRKTPEGGELVMAAQGLVLPNKINLRQKTQATLFPIELGGIITERNTLSEWFGPNYAIPLRALSSRTMAQQPTFNHSGWERRRTPKQGLMTRFEVVREDDGRINQLNIFAWVVDISTGQPTPEQTGATWEIPNRF